MRTIWKYPLLLDDVQEVSMPVGSELLSVGVQTLPGLGQSIVLWAKVEDGWSKVRRRIYICGTGGPAPEEASYVGTVQMGDFVWHVFDGGEA